MIDLLVGLATIVQKKDLSLFIVKKMSKKLQIFGQVVVLILAVGFSILIGGGIWYFFGLTISEDFKLSRHGVLTEGYVIESKCVHGCTSYHVSKRSSGPTYETTVEYSGHRKVFHTGSTRYTPGTLDIIFLPNDPKVAKFSSNNNFFYLLIHDEVGSIISRLLIIFVIGFISMGYIYSLIDNFDEFISGIKKLRSRKE